jgi:HEAT repeat protein
VGGDAQVRVAAVTALGAMGTDAKEALPQLYKAVEMKHLETQQRALQAIMVVGRDDLPAVLKELRAIDRRGQWATPYVLSQFGPTAKDAVAPLTEALEDKDAATRLGAALALGRIGPDAKEAIPALEKLVKDPNAQVAAAARLALASVDRDPAKEQALADAAELALRQIQETRRLLEAKGLAVKELKDALAQAPRPVDRKLLFDPHVQAQFDSVVFGFTFAIMAVTKKGGCPAAAGLEKEAQRVMDALPPEAAPSLVRALNLVGRYRLGFT